MSLAHSAPDDLSVVYQMINQGHTWSDKMLVETLERWLSLLQN